MGVGRGRWEVYKWGGEWGVVNRMHGLGTLLQGWGDPAVIGAAAWCLADVMVDILGERVVSWWIIMAYFKEMSSVVMDILG